MSRQIDQSRGSWWAWSSSALSRIRDVSNRTKYAPCGRSCGTCSSSSASTMIDRLCCSESCCSRKKLCLASSSNPTATACCRSTDARRAHPGSSRSALLDIPFPYGRRSARTWSGVATQKAMRECARSVAPIRSRGPITHPICVGRQVVIDVPTRVRLPPYLTVCSLWRRRAFQPVTENDFPAEPTVSVRSHMPARAAALHLDAALGRQRGATQPRGVHRLKGRTGQGGDADVLAALVDQAVVLWIAPAGTPQRSPSAG